MSGVLLVTGDCDTLGDTLKAWEFTYDGDGTKVKQAYTDSNGTLTTYYFMGGSYEVQTDGTTETVRQYYAIASVTAGMREGSTFYYFLTDHLGSVVGVTDSTGILVSETRYLQFGEIRTDVGTVSQTDYGYTFQRNINGMGLTDYKARYYSTLLGRFTQPDSIIPGAGNPQAFNRYAYSNNNPINYNDPTGHMAGWFGNFLYGFSAEFVRTNNWIGAITAPTVAQALAPSSSESNAMLAGRIVADLATLAIGVTEIISGGTIAGGGAVVGCGTTLCLASVPAIAAGVAVISTGVMTTTSGSVGLGENLGIVFSKRHSNDLHPDPDATGPQSTYKQDPVTGKTTNYQSYEPVTNPQGETFWNKILRYDGIGRAHPDSKTGVDIIPHIHDFLNGIVRKPSWYELPN